MKMLMLLSALFLATAAKAQHTVASVWILDSSTITYALTHPVHEVEGTSHQSRGKGICQSGRCEFLIATPVKSFDSGDTNRDLHMLQVVRGAEFPIVTMRFSIPESASTEASFVTDLEVSFAGQIAHYSSVRFAQTTENDKHKITGVIPAKLSDFRIEAPRFLTVPVHNDIPIKIEAMWHRDQQ